MMCEDYPCCGHGPGETGGDGGFKVIRPAAGSFARKVLSDPGTHNWVKDQFIASLDRDPVDALADARLLSAMLEDRWRTLRDKGMLGGLS